VKLYLFVRPVRSGTAGDVQELDVDAMDELLPRMRDAVTKGTDVLHAKVVELLSRPGTRQTSSAPGQPPEMDFGVFVRSFRKRYPGTRAKKVVRGTVESRHPAAIAHEVGTRRIVNGKIVRVAAHPYMRPAIRAVTPEIDRIFEAL
jgi:hypothetical protein